MTKHELFSIHKLGIDNDQLEAAQDPWPYPQRFSEPPVLRIGPPTIGNGAQFAALGTHIIGTCPSINEPMSLCGTLTFDTKTAKLSASRIVPRGYDTAIAVGNRLYVFESVMNKNVFLHGALHCLVANPNDDDDDRTWLPLPGPDNPPEVPFDPSCTVAHAVHPWAGTMLVSTSRHAGSGTFSYDSGQWERLGDWLLPFKGHAHYDHDLAAWVGFHRQSSGIGDRNDGYLCACRVDMSSSEPPKWEIAKEKLFLEHPHWIHVDAKLVYTGERSKYSLVERLLRDGTDELMHVLCLTTSIVTYGEEGELRTMTDKPPRYYKAPSYRTHFDMQAL
ncbi:hypothetical protein VPH35_024838 [Triticum aestivum]